MKLFKKALGVLTMTMVVAGGCFNVMANELNPKILSLETVGNIKVSKEMMRSSVIEHDTDAPEVTKVETDVRDEKIYMMIHVNDKSGVKTVKVGGHKASLYSGDEFDGIYSYRVTSGGKYYIYVEDEKGNYENLAATINIDEEKPELELSQEYDDGRCYLVIKASDNGRIETVTVNGAEISFDEDKGIERYRVDESGRYTVIVTDEAGIETKKSLYVDVDADKPELKLSKEYKNNKWYLIIKASPTNDNRLSEVTVNGESISFDLKGDEVSYRVTKTGTYKVVVTDDIGMQEKESLYINAEDYKDAEKPDLKLSKEYKNNKWYLVIKASPTNDNKLSEVTVNGESISFNSRGDEVSYRVTKTGTYKVVVTDDLGMQEKESLYIDVSEETDNEKPVLNLSQSNIGSSRYYLVIKASDNEKVARIKVNGTSVAIPSDGSAILYEVQPGKYTVWASDAAGNEVQKSIEIVGNDGPVSPEIPSTGAQVVKFRLYHKDWTINGVQQAEMDTPPLNQNGRIYLPLRFTAYALGVDSGQITWDSGSQTAIIYDGYDVIKVTLGARYMMVNGEPVAMDSPAICINNRVLLPISQVSKAFVSKGVSLNWNNTAKEITITRSN